MYYSKAYQRRLTSFTKPTLQKEKWHRETEWTHTGGYCVPSQSLIGSTTLNHLRD